ncbi:hypothetical protein HKX48_004150 [Thoreauomyces humboldtii]|nr:hypothetical protein HKX48_004150 [Thoreauomyces humboldtii]
MTSVDEEVAKSFGLSIISKNERGQRSIVRPTCFYMPHCGHTLYNAVLRTNWNDLPRLLVVGNSFSTYGTLLMGSSNKAPFVCAAEADEVPFPKGFESPEVFNNTSLHWFRAAGRIVADAQVDGESDPEVL